MNYLTCEEKAKRYDQWFEPGRCPACHFEEKHVASCLVGRLERKLEAVRGAVLGEYEVAAEDILTILEEE